DLTGGNHGFARLICNGFQLIREVCIQVLGLGAGGKGANIRSSGDDVNLVGCSSFFSSFGVNEGPTGSTIMNFTRIRVDPTLALTLRYLHSLALTGDQCASTTCVNGAITHHPNLPFLLQLL